MGGGAAGAFPQTMALQRSSRFCLSIKARVSKDYKSKVERTHPSPRLPAYAVARGAVSTAASVARYKYPNYAKKIAPLAPQPHVPYYKASKVPQPGPSAAPQRYGAYPTPPHVPLPLSTRPAQPTYQPQPQSHMYNNTPHSYSAQTGSVRPTNGYPAPGVSSHPSLYASLSSRPVASLYNQTQYVDPYRTPHNNVPSGAYYSHLPSQQAPPYPSGSYRESVHPGQYHVSPHISRPGSSAPIDSTSRLADDRNRLDTFLNSNPSVRDALAAAMGPRPVNSPS